MSKPSDDGYVVLERIGVPFRRWAPVALLAAFIIDGLKPVAEGNAAGASFLAWSAVCLAVTWFRNRRTAVELTENALIIKEPARRVPRVILVSFIASVDLVKVGSRTVFVVRTTNEELVALPTPVGTWWMYGEEPYVKSHNLRVQTWLRERRAALAVGSE